MGDAQVAEKFDREKKARRLLQEDETKDLILQVIRSAQSFKGLQVGQKIIITQEKYFGQKQGNEFYQQMTGDHSVYLGRSHQPHQYEPFIGIVGPGDSNQPQAPEWRFSRNHIRIAFEKGFYWIQDLKTTNPICIILQHAHPMKLQQGMMIKTGHEEDSFLKIDQISTEEEKFNLETKKGEDLHQFFSWKNSKVEYGAYKRQNFLKILDERNNKVGECYPNDQNDRVWHLVSKGFNWKVWNMEFDDCLFINNVSDPGYWGDVYYEKGIGWYLIATEKGEKSQFSLKVALKDNDQLYNDGGSDSSQVQIYEGMEISIGITHDYIIKATTRFRKKSKQIIDQGIQDIQTYTQGIQDI